MTDFIDYHLLPSGGGRGGIAMNKFRTFRIVIVMSMITLNLLLAQAQGQSNKQIKGNGTVDRIPKFIKPDVIGDSVMTELNGNIGVGTTTPGSKLTVAGRIEAFNTGISAGVLGQSPAGAGVRGNSDSGAGVFGSSDTGFGTRGQSNSNFGLFGLSLNNAGVAGQSENSGSAGVQGFNTKAGGTGVLGQAFNGTGVRGISSSGFGVFGSSETFTAVEARSNTGFGVFGSSNTNTGIHGQSNGGTGVFGSSAAGNRAGVHALNSGGGIALLAESPNGTGVIAIIGAPGPNLYIAEEVADNSFKIAGGAPGMRVSWQVTGIRRDPYANKRRIKVEEEKPERERDHYLHPDLYNQPEEKSVEWARNPRLMQQMKEQRKQK
jgi:hypothetical protein